MHLLTGNRKMCTNLHRLPDGSEVYCRKCQQCSQDYVNDWVGRCVAESKTAVASHSVTLTYGRDQDGNEDHPNAALLTYSDVQKWFKRLRNEGYLFRYFAVGEYGSKKGRSHWHVIIYWQDNSAVIAERLAKNPTAKRVQPVPDGVHPPLKLQSNVVQAHWDAGFSFFDELHARDAVANCKAVRYVCKYAMKDLRDMERQGLLRQSRFPPLGAEWFRRHAGEYVEQGISPQSLSYRHAGVKMKDGRSVIYMLRKGSASADLFIEAFNEQWAKAYDCEPVTASRTIMRGPKGKQVPVTETKIVGFTGRGNPPPPSPVLDEYGDRYSTGALERARWQKKEDQRAAELAEMRALREVAAEQGLSLGQPVEIAGYLDRL